MDDDHLADTEDVDVDACLLLDAVYPGDIGYAVDDVELPGEQTGLTAGDVGHVAILDTVDLGCPAEVVRVGLEHHLFLGAVALEHEGAGADGVGLELVRAQRLDRLFADDEATGVVGHLGVEQDR